MTNVITSCNEYTSPWAGFKFLYLVMIATDHICSCKSNYHTFMFRRPWPYKRGGPKLFVFLDRCILENGVKKTVQKYSNKPDCFKLIYQYKIQFGHGNFIKSLLLYVFYPFFCCLQLFPSFIWKISNFSLHLIER